MATNIYTEQHSLNMLDKTLETLSLGFIYIYIFVSCTCIEYWHRVREVPSSIPSQAPRQHSTLKKGSTGMALSQELR